MSAQQHALSDGRRGANPVIVIGALFFIFGFVTWLNGPLITFVKLAFDLDDVNAFLVPMAFYLSYFFLALPSSWILRRTGMKRGMALGLFVMAVGALLFGQFATMRVYPGALTGLFVIGAGLSLLQTASNPYISILGPIDAAARRIAVMGICNKTAGILAPLLLGALVLRGIGDFAGRVAAADPAGKEALLNQFAAQIHLPYLVMAAVLALVVGAPTAGGIHLAKGSTRLVSTAGTAGLANPFISIGEDFLALAISALGIFIPFVGFAVSLIFAYLAFRGWRAWQKRRTSRRVQPPVQDS